MLRDIIISRLVIKYERDRFITYFCSVCTAVQVGSVTCIPSQYLVLTCISGTCRRSPISIFNLTDIMCLSGSLAARALASPRATPAVTALSFAFESEWDEAMINIFYRRDGEEACGCFYLEVQRNDHYMTPCTRSFFSPLSMTLCSVPKVCSITRPSIGALANTETKASTPPSSRI